MVPSTLYPCQWFVDIERFCLFLMFDFTNTDFATSQLRRLSTVSFVPVKADKGAVEPNIRWLPPTQCYLGSEAQESFHSRLFIFVDFGSGANAFLIACGTKSRPNVEEVAKILLADPRQFYELASGPNKSLYFPDSFFGIHSISLAFLPNCAT